MDSAFAEIKLKLITPNGCISACGQVKNFIGIKSAQWVEWRLKKLLILAEEVADCEESAGFIFSPKSKRWGSL